MFLANVIFPAPSAVYYSTLFIPLATILAFVTELSIFRRWQDGIISNPRILLTVAELNLFSWLAGLAISSFLPSYLAPHLTEGGVSIVGHDPHWGTVALLSFPFACLLSTLLEYLALRLLLRRIPFRQPFRCVALANLASYIVLGATVAVFLHFNWF